VVSTAHRAGTAVFCDRAQVAQTTLDLPLSRIYPWPSAGNRAQSLSEGFPGNGYTCIVLIHSYSGVARICCEEGQRLKLCHGALTVDFGAGCSSWSMT